MSKQKQVREELRDKADKLMSAQEVAARPEASTRDISDLKMIEQDFLAEQKKAERLALRGDRVPPRPKSDGEKRDRKLDDALADSFPGSDPVSFLTPTPRKKKPRD